MKFMSYFLDVLGIKKSNNIVSYDEIISLLILSNNSLPIKKVSNLSKICSINYEEDKIDELIDLVKKEDIKCIEKRFQGCPKTFEDLSLFTFSNELNERFVAIVYDSDELWQNPELLKIVKL